MRRSLRVPALVLLCTACRVESRDDYLGDKDPPRFQLGRAATPAYIAAIDIDASPSGAGLPPGSGTPEQGAAIYAAMCASCHGANGEGEPPNPRLTGGTRGSFDFASDYRIPRTIGNYWPYATTLYDYLRRAMPPMTPGSLSADQTYAVTAYLLNREGLFPPGATLNAKALAAVRMPAKPHFVEDDRRGTIGGARTR